MGKFFNNGLKEEDEKEGLLKRLKNIEGKNEEELKAIEDQGKKQLEEIKNVKTDSKSSKIIRFFNGLNSEAKELLDELKEEKNSINSKRLVCVKSDGTIFNFNVFKISLDFASDIYDDKISLKEAKNSHYKMFELLNNLKEYNPTKLDKIRSREETLNDAEKLYKNRSSIIKAFENGVFPFNYGFQKEKSDV